VLSTNIPGFSYSQFADPVDGGDLRFANSNRTLELDYEVEQWNTNSSRFITPTNIPGCVLWLKADDGVQTNGNIVTNWLDRSGLNNHAFQTNVSWRPTLSGNSIGGRPAIIFDGVDDYLVANDSDSLDGAPALTAFAVVVPSNISGAPTGIFSKRKGTNNQQSYSQFFWSGRLYADIVGDGNRLSGTMTCANGMPCLATTRYDGSLPQADRLKNYINGSLDVIGPVATNFIPNYASELVIATLNVGYTSFLAAAIAEILIYTNALTDTDIFGVQWYLTQKYQLSTSLEYPGRSAIWVRIPGLSENNTSIMAFWGNENATNRPPSGTNGAVWADSFKAVWHMNVTNAQDATTNAHHGTAEGNITVAGNVGAAQKFAGSDRIQVPYNSDFDLPSNFCLEGWFWMDFASRADWRPLFSKQVDFNDRNWWFGLTSKGYFWWKYTPGVNTSNTIDLADSKWHYFAGVHDGSAARLYIDGSQQFVVPSPANANVQAQPVYIGSEQSTRYFKGNIDEIRVSNVGRSPNWIWACWMNQASNSLFWRSEGISKRSGTIMEIR
jgi:hypothetical protein